MDSSKTEIKPIDAAPPPMQRKPSAPVQDDAPADLVEFIEPQPLDVVEFEPPPRTISEFVETDSGVPFNDWPFIPNPLKHPLKCVGWVLKSVFSVVVLIALLALVAAVPIASIFVLGYLLEVEGRIARSGRVRDGFPLLPQTPRIGSILAGISLWLLPLFFIAGMAADATLIDPTGAAAGRWQAAKLVLGALIAVHLCLALARGGSFGCFLRPVKNIRWLFAELRNRTTKGNVRCPECGEAADASATHCALCGFTPQECAQCGDAVPLAATECAKCGREAAAAVADEPKPFVGNLYWHRADRKVRKFVKAFRLKHHFVLGGRAMFSTLVILLIPTLLFAAAKRADGLAILATIIGGICLAIAFLYVPFLQARLAAENRRGAMFELRSVRGLYAYAPISWFVALLLVYALALPLYLFTAFAPPRDAMWLVTLVFVASIYPARIVTGWAYSRAARRMRDGKPKSHWFFRHGCRVLMFSTTAAYTLFFFFSRDIGAHGRLVLFEHHAFLGTTLSSLFALLP